MLKVDHEYSVEKSINQFGLESVVQLGYPVPEGKKYFLCPHQQKLQSLKWKIGAKA